MRFTGQFDRFNRPVITVYILFPSIHAEGNIDFLVDTGADGTTLNLQDATAIGIDVSSLIQNGQSRGVGVAPKFPVETAGTLLFTADDGSTKLPVSHPSVIVLKNVSYSLLGRDVMRLFKLYMNKSSVYLET